MWSYLEPLPKAASLSGLIGIPDDDPAVQLLINAVARSTSTTGLRKRLSEPAAQAGHDILERHRVVDGLISEYQRAA